MIRLGDLLGQAAAGAQLAHALGRNRLHHALLFVGPGGIGKLAAAERLAQVLQCSGDSDQRPADAACGRCGSCIRFTSAGHADVRILRTDEKMLKVDAVREATQFLQLRPNEGRFKILIIADADKMNPQAQNALLKTLEEPPGEARLILTTSRPYAILVTVLSRCQQVRFRPLSLPELTAFLIEQGRSPEHAPLLAGLAQGSPERALSADPEQLRARRDRIAALDEQLEPGRPRSAVEALAQAEQLQDDSEALRPALELYMIWLRDQAVLAADPSHPEIANLDRRDTLRALAERRGLYEVLRRARALEAARKALDSPYNLNGLMILEQLCLSLAGHLTPGESP